MIAKFSNFKVNQNKTKKQKKNQTQKILSIKAIVNVKIRGRGILELFLRLRRGGLMQEMLIFVMENIFILPISKGLIM